MDGETENGAIHVIPVGRIRVANPRSRNREMFAALVDSIASVGLKRPITVRRTGSDENGPKYDLICGQGRLEAVVALGEKTIPALIEDTTEAEAYLRGLIENMARRKHTNRDLLTAIRILEDAVEMMISANRFTLSYAKVLLAVTRPEHLIDPARPKKVEGMSATDIARMEHEMERLRRDYRSVEDSLGDIMLSLVVAKGYVAKLFRNEAVADYINRHHAELAMEMRGILEAVGSDARTLGR